jgi:hypothetical protein
MSCKSEVGQQNDWNRLQAGLHVPASGKVLALSQPVKAVHAMASWLNILSLQLIIINKTLAWSSQHSLHYPTPVRGSMSQCVDDNNTFAEDARPGLTLLHCDVNARVPARPASMAITDRQFGMNCDFGLPSPLPSMAVDAGTFLPSGVITNPSPPSTAYHDDDFLGADCAHAYADWLPVMTRSTAHPLANHYPLDRQTAQSTGGFQEAAHQKIISLHHRFAADMATPFPGYSSLQSPHDYPICEPPSFGTAIYAKELPRPGSAPSPPLIDSQVPFIGDARAVLPTPFAHMRSMPDSSSLYHRCIDL